MKKKLFFVSINASSRWFFLVILSSIHLSQKKKDKRKRGKNAEVVSNEYSEGKNHTIQKYTIDRFHESSYLFFQIIRSSIFSKVFTFH